MILGIITWVSPGLQTGEAHSGTLDDSAAWTARGGGDPRTAQFHHGELGMGNLSDNPVGALRPSAAADPEFPITQLPAADGSATHVYTWAAHLMLGRSFDATYVVLLEPPLKEIELEPASSAAGN